MGGSKCSYRKCTMRSGLTKVHMFHFPVYDKRRCHQWLANAQKFEFLNLKLSQLKNRIVCQYHFKDDCFMNYKKDKLTFNAVPTEDGPYCEPSLESTESQETAPNDVYPLILNENEGDDKYLKRHKSSIIYADFLTNGDYWEKQSLNETIWNNKVVSKKPDSLLEGSIDMPVKDESVENSSTTLPKIWPDEMGSNVIVEIENPIEPGVKENIRYEVENISSCDITRNKKTQIKQQDNKMHGHKPPNHEFNNLLINKEPLNTIENHSSKSSLSLSDEMKTLQLNQENTNVPGNFYQLNASVIEPWHENRDNLLTSKNNCQKSLQTIEMQYSGMPTTFENKPADLGTPYEIQLQYEPSSSFIINQNLKENIGGQEDRNRLNNKEGTVKPKIQILFEETITEPIKIPDKLEPISPSTVINIKEKSRDYKRTKRKNNYDKIELCAVDNVIKNTGVDIESNLQTIYSKNNDKPIENIPKTSPTSTASPYPVTRGRHSQSCQSSNHENIPKTHAIKHKISPERIATIEKKRNFNKKLRDIIETCLEKLDEQDRTCEIATVTHSPKKAEATGKKNSLIQNVGSYLSKQPELPNTQEYTMKYIEARMKKMEDVLLNKIEENSQKISELKKCIRTTPLAHKSTTTQTSSSEESYKKQLYQEMSKFLSPDANSLIYEELFINKYAQKISNQPSTKRRKRR